jgi:hypothetical protein
MAYLKVQRRASIKILVVKLHNNRVAADSTEIFQGCKSDLLPLNTNVVLLRVSVRTVPGDYL